MILTGVIHFYLTGIQTRLQAQAAGVSYNGLCRMASFETVCLHQFSWLFTCKYDIIHVT